MLLLDDASLEARRAAIRGPLAPLFDSLALEIEPLIGRVPFVPEAKSLLSRAGGRCEVDGASLDFDPWSPHRHRCPACGTIHQGELHDRAWITSYQLWLAERAVHAALFHLLRGEQRHADLAREILDAYVDRYLRYPNQDNVLGPTRLFFSTYLESIWLLQICVATDLLERAGDHAIADRVRDRIVEPSAALISEYDEGVSNRQVWNNAAMLAAAALRRDRAAFELVVHGDSGLRSLLQRALLGDGTWYEGENYHLFALRGLWYSVTLFETHGGQLEPDIDERLRKAFVAPFVTALPDFTMPSRKDSQYAVSLRQWRIAEMTELGYARYHDDTLAAALARCYESGHARRDTGRAHSAADVERNAPSGALTRADLGWRALLHSVPDLPALPVLPPRSALLEQQGLAVFRRDHDVYVALDFGQSGGGHGHPDRLNLLVSQASTRWLDDLGTGSYVDPSLHWYRSTLAHNAPLVDGRSQPRRDGVLRAHDEREGLGWIVGAVDLPESDLRLERTLVVAPDYLIDELRWSASRSVRVELPLHLDATAHRLTFSPAPLGGGDGLEDGFSFVSDSGSAPIPAGAPVLLSADAEGRALRVTLTSDRDTTLFSACGPGQPAAVPRRFYVRRAESAEGVFRAVVSWSADALRADVEDDRVIIESAGERHEHRRDAAGWHVELFAGRAHSTIDLAGFRPQPDPRQHPLPAARTPAVLRRGRVPRTWISQLTEAQRAALLTFELGEAHYRRSEDRWSEAGSPRATILMGADDRDLIIFADVRAGHLRFIDAAAINPFDNEQADTMGAGLQVYVRTPDTSGGWTLVPEPPPDAGRVRVRPITGWGGHVAPRAHWRKNADGYEVRVELPLLSETGSECPIDLDLIVNETTAARQRRRGQLVMSGARGEFVYLRGDRHDAMRLIPLVVVT